MDLQELQDKATKYLRAYEGFKDVVVEVQHEGEDEATLYLDGHDFFIGVTGDFPMQFEPGYIKHTGGFNSPPEAEDYYYDVDVDDGCHSLAEACAILVMHDYLDSLQSFAEDELVQQLQQEEELAHQWRQDNRVREQ